MRVSSRRGSALLIVLGMVAFMVISAVAFSAYMRYSRLPSSFLRRSVSSRQLVKAALANAIDEIDAAIGNNPHPGVGTQANPYPRHDGSTTYNRNWWKGRVYIGTNTTLLVAQKDTVSPLCLEGLAYIPPPLVNEARYYSRHSTASRWHTLPFDVGRYVFCAIDVSDYFDINAIGAADARSSHPGSRISLSHLFESVDHLSPTGEWDADEWHTKFQQLYNAGGKVPLVSMADWNLAINDLGLAGWFSPFCEYVTGNSGMFYRGNDPDYVEKVRRMMFVTDSYFPEETAVTTDYSLGEDANQPFGGIAQGKTGLMLINDGPSGSRAALWKKYLGSLGFCALYDYLDYDSVPCSLALPTTERVPMVCGIRPSVPTFDVTVVKSDPVIAEGGAQATPNPDIQQQSIDITLTYMLDPGPFVALSASKLEALVAYPFRHDDGLPTQQFVVDGWLSLYFTSSAMKLRTGNNGDLLHFSDRLVNESPTGAIVGRDNAAVISIPFAPQPVTFNVKGNANLGEQDAVKQVQLSAAAASTIAGDIGSRKLAEVVFKGTQQRRKIPNGTGGFTWGEWEPSKDELIENLFDPSYRSAPVNATVTATSDFIPLTAEGLKDEVNFPGGRLENLLSGTASLQCSLNAATWVRVRNNDGKTVDLVPACLTDDSKLGLGVSAPQMCAQLDNTFFGSLYPVMRFDTGVQLEYGAAGVKAVDPAALTIAPQAVYVGDPRYNHAPESWFTAAGGFSPTDWLTACHAHDADRDGDIFMSVSDQGYLQSIYELANLPRLTRLFTGGDYGLGFSGGELYERPDNVYSQNTFPAQFEETANRHVMWRTYDPFRREGNRRGNFPSGYEWPEDGDCFDPTLLNGSTAERFVNPKPNYAINPYSDNTNHLMAAFANAPHEWRLAGTNESCQVLQQGLPVDAKTFNASYAWNAYSSGAKIPWEDLESLAGEFMYQVREAAKDGKATTDPKTDRTNFNAVWEDAWDGLEWASPDVNNAKQELCGQTLSNLAADHYLYNTDKKFLYGYWRDCFAVRQQLFLIFVRAEPAMMGGASIAATPPQLGTKAVALVWRDPNGKADPRRPHQTRVLFYRQFE